MEPPGNFLGSQVCWFGIVDHNDAEGFKLVNLKLDICFPVSGSFPVQEVIHFAWFICRARTIHPSQSVGKWLKSGDTLTLVGWGR